MQKETTKKENVREGHVHAEDLAQKAAVQYFGEEILTWLDIHEKVREVAPTEHVKLEVRHTYEDFCFIMENGEWYHFEFESGKVTRTDLKRFREYEATTSRVHDVDVITFILCSDKQQKMLEELKTGINTYKVRMILLKDFSVDEVMTALGEKENDAVSSFDLIPVALGPLLGGSMPMKTRIMEGFQMLAKPYPEIKCDKLQCLQAVLFILATKFLEKEDMKEVKEVFDMTYLGQLVYDDGFQAGREEGREKERERSIFTMILDNLESNVTKENIFAKLKRHYALEQDQAEAYWERYQNNSDNLCLKTEEMRT